MGSYLLEVAVETFVCGLQEGSDGEAVCVLLVTDLRLLHQRVQLLPDEGLHLVPVVAIALRIKMVESSARLPQKPASRTCGTVSTQRAIQLTVGGAVG